MVIFNHTFTDDKPVYFPANWETGKTLPELHEEWKLTLQHDILSNILQVLVAAAWIGIGIVIVTAGRELKRYVCVHAGWPIWSGRAGRRRRTGGI
jgi:hypothetical protein